MLHMLQQPDITTNYNPITVQSMPRSPELRNLLNRTIAQLGSLKEAGVPATDRNTELYMIDNHLNSPCTDDIPSAQPSYHQINAFRRREEPQASDAAIHMALNAFVGAMHAMHAERKGIDVCMCDEEYCKFALDIQHRPQKRRRRSRPSAGGTDTAGCAAGHVAKHVRSALTAEMRLYDRAKRHEARNDSSHVQNTQDTSDDPPTLGILKIFPAAPGCELKWTVYPGQAEPFIVKPGPKKGYKYSATHTVEVNGCTYTVPMRYTLVNIEELNKLKAAAKAQESSPARLKDTIINAPQKMALEPLAWSCLTRRDYCSARVIFDEGASNADLKVALATFCCDAEHTEYFKFWMPRDVAALYDAAFAIQKANRTACMQKAEVLGLETSGAVGELRARISTHLMDRVPPMETWKQRDTETANASDAGDADDARDARDAGDAPDAGDARGASDAGDE